MTAYDLTTARGVCKALGDGHDIVDTITGRRVVIDGDILKLFTRAGELLLDIQLSGGGSSQELAPKPVDSLTAQELAQEFYNDPTASVSSCSIDDNAWVCIKRHSPPLSCSSMEVLTKQLRALVRAKRAGEL